VREQDCASQCDVRDLVSRDAQRRDAQFVVYESVGPAHGQLLPPSSAGLAAGQAGMAAVMGGHEMDERVRLAERAVDPGLARSITLTMASSSARQQTSRMTARALAHSMVVTAVRSGRATRSIPAIITGTG
jgi:hypothetical protein